MKDMVNIWPSLAILTKTSSHLEPYLVEFGSSCWANKSSLNPSYRTKGGSSLNKYFKIHTFRILKHFDLSFTPNIGLKTTTVCLVKNLERIINFKSVFNYRLPNLGSLIYHTASKFDTLWDLDPESWNLKLNLFSKIFNLAKKSQSNFPVI